MDLCSTQTGHKDPRYFVRFLLQGQSKADLYGNSLPPASVFVS